MMIVTSNSLDELKLPVSSLTVYLSLRSDFISSKKLDLEDFIFIVTAL